MADPKIVDPIQGLTALGAPESTIAQARALIDEGKDVKLSVSDGNPPSVALLVDDRPAVTFTAERQVSQRVLDDPRLGDAPRIDDEAVKSRTVTIGKNQLIQVLLARGFEIPEDCVVLYDGEPMKGEITVSFILNPAD